MKSTNKLYYPNYLQNIFDKLDNNGIRPIIIGGFVRDYLLNITSKQESKDIDVELYGVLSFKQLENILNEFGKINNVGKSFGVCKLSFKNLEIDFTLPRIDNKISSGHSGFKVDIDKNLDFKTATSRRDFTINAIGYDTIDKKIQDPFNGLNDLKNKLLKAVDINKFGQDPLRVLRAVGFCSRFNFKMDDKLFLVCKDMCEQNALNELAKERVYEEIKKILLKSTKPSIGFFLLKKLNALKYFTPLDTLNKCEFTQTLKALDEMAKNKTNNNKTNIILMLSILCNKLDFQQTKKFISNLTNEKEVLKNILSLIGNKFEKNYDDSQLYKLATKVNIEHFLLFNKAIHYLVEDKIFSDLKKRAIKLNILNKKAPPYLLGKDILACGIKPSKEYSTILSEAYDAQMNLKIKNHDEAILWLKNYLT